MKRAWLFSLGSVLGLAAETILWNGPDLVLLEDGWHWPAFTRMVGVGVIVEGALVALAAALCLGRALGPLSAEATPGGTDWAAAVGGGPVLPVCGILLLLAGFETFGQAQKVAHTLAVMESEPGNIGPEIVADYRSQVGANWTLCILWLVGGAALVMTPLILKPWAWRLGWPMSGVGCGIAAGGFLLSGLGAFVCFANGLAMEGASKDVSFVGLLGVLMGAIVAVMGSVVTVLGRSKQSTIVGVIAEPNATADRPRCAE
jgi:hypothetical protein